jgi:hypothetical protein
MPERSPRKELLRRVGAWAIGWLAAAALYLLLIDITELPELLVGAGAAALAATAMELAREQQIAGEGIRLRWLARGYRPLLRAPPDVALLCVMALRQVFRPRQVQGEFRAVPFDAKGSRTLRAGRRAAAEALGSFAPNTIVVGVDSEAKLILAHQLRRSRGRRSIDPLGLG